MRSRWLRMLAVLLAVSLLLNSGSWGLEFRSYATESDNLENLIKSESTDDADDSSDDSDSDVDADSDDSADADANSGSESGTDGTDESTTGTGAAGSDANGENADGENAESDGLTDGDVAADDELTSDDELTDDELAAEGELTEEELLALENAGIATLALEDSADNRVGLPEDASGYEAYEDSGKIYVFSSAEDYKKLQEHSAETSFEGVAFRIGTPDAGSVEINDAFFENLTDFTFEGFGTKDYPFKGSIACDYSAGSTSFKLSKTLFNYVGAGAEIWNFSLVCDENTETAVAKHILFGEDETEKVSIHDLTITGVIGVDDTEAAGTIAGTISDNAVIELADVTSTVTEINGKLAGGIAGTIGSDVTITAEDTTLSGTVSGAEAAGGYFGVVTGSHTWNVSENTLGIGLSVKTTSSDGYAGTFAGKLCKGDSETTLTIENENEITINAKVSGAGISGGLLGVCEEDTIVEIEQPLTVTGEVAGSTAGGLLGIVSEAFTLKLDEFTCSAKVVAEKNAGGVFGTIEADEFTPELFSGSDGNDDSDSSDESPQIKIMGTIDGYDGYAGGYAATIRANVVIPEITTQNSTVISAKSGAGGVAGRLTEGSRCIIKGASIGAESGSGDGGSIKAEYAGGIVGVVEDASAVELQDTFVIHAVLSDGTIGSVAGKVEESLVYLSEPVSTGDRSEQLVFDTATEPWAEVGISGGVFRNQSTGDDSVLIGDGTLGKVGEVSDGYVSGADGTYTLKGTEGLECLAIALWTEGNFGMSPFGASDGNSDQVAVLLRANYTLDGDADISYDTTGIITINRNDKTDAAYAFAGSLVGADSDTEITQNSRTYSDGVTPYEESWQEKTGLFSTLTGDNTFKNLRIEGCVQYENGTGGIAYQTIGSSLTLENIEMRKVFKNLSTGDAIGGILATEASEADTFQIRAEDITLASEIYAGKNTEFAGFIVNANKIDLELDDITLGGVLKSETGTDAATGGFLGKKWENVTGYIGKDDGMQVESGTVFYACGQFGGLINELYNREGEYVTLQNIDLDKLTVEVAATSNRSSNNCGLLIRVGRGLAANIVDYSCKGCTIKGAGYNFDEIVGTANNNGNNTSGIISLHSTSVAFPEYHYEEQATYVDSSARNSTASNARYFYEVYQVLEEIKAGGAKIGTTFTDPKEVLIWSVYYNTNLEMGYGVQNIFKNWLTISDTYTFSGTIDLSETAIYPLPNLNGITLKGENDATLIFDASNMNDQADSTDDAPDKLHTTDGAWSLPNNYKSGIKSQHYGLHSGLLLNASGISVSDLTLSGTVANRGTGSGALVAGTLSGGGSFTNITLDDLWIDKYNGEDNYGLLISTIAADDSGTKQENTVDVTFGAAGGVKGVSMTGYSADSGKKAAAALIGKVGSTDMTNLKLDFRNMQVADEKTDGKEHNGDVFAKASYICTYQHTSNADAYTGRCWYLFTKEEADEDNGGLLTYGSEIDGDTEYWWEDTENPDPHELVIETIQQTDSDFDPADYLPYVYQEELIEVNPKPGDITEGCGTYEDPYIIESRKQFLTLYRYLNMMKENSTSTADTEFFTDWKVNGFGSDAVICDKVHTEDDQKIFGNDDFPTQAQMRGAYYRLGADIDMSQMTSGNYKTIADNFVGFGTKEYPFTGVWYGMGEDGTVHTVTLPSKSTFREYDSFGLLQYAKGAVVKDMIIKSAEPDTDAGETQSDVITRVTGKGMAGSVIGCVLGGDNIIDNVSVDTEFMALNYSATVNNVVTEKTYSLAAVGGYVGCVKKGGLILRNTELTNVVDFAVYNSSMTKLTGNTDNSRYLGGFVGRVEDGYVLHEDGSVDAEGDNSDPIWQKNKTGGAGSYALTPDYEIVDGDYLEDETTGSSGIQISTPDTSGNITAKLPNAASLQVLSMAVTCDALNTRPETASEQETTPKTWGYTGYSRSRKAEYSAIGCGAKADSASGTYDSSCGSDYQAATAYDNQNSCPYLYKYLNIEPAAASTYIKSDSSGNYGMAILNASEQVSGTYYHTTWKLTSNDTYGMSVFGGAFRGIGALYDMEDGYGGTFRGNFDGDGDEDGTNAVISLDMKSIAWNVCKDDTELSPDSLRCMGLFNTLRGVSDTSWYETNGMEIRNLAITGSLQVANDVSAAASSSSLPVDIGGIAGRSSAKLTLSNVTAEDLYVWSGINNTTYVSTQTARRMGCVGGLIGNLTGMQEVVIEDCLVKNTDKSTGAADTPQMKGLGFAGGFIGAIGNSYNSIYTTAEVTITGSGCMAENLYIESMSEVAGGLVGYAPYGTKLTIRGEGTQSSTDDWLGVKDCTVVSYWNAGGVVGETGIVLDLEKVLVQNATVKAYKNAGGIVGETSGSITTGSSITDVKVYDSIIQERETTSTVPHNDESGQGGIVGKNTHTLTITNAEVGVTSDTAVGMVQSVANNRIRTGGGECPNGVGGIVGYHKANSMLLGDCLVKGIIVKADKAAAYINGTFESIVCAGGIVGYGNSTILLTGDYIHTENLTVTTVVPDDYGYGKYLSAGGCFGLNKTVKNVTGNYYNGLSSVNNIVRGKTAGGISGVALTSMWLSGRSSAVSDEIPGGTTVSGGSIHGVESAGGLIGGCKHANGYNFSLNEQASTDAQAAANPVVLVEGVTITGKFIGGAVGSMMMGGPVRIENLKISNCKIIGTTMTEASGVGSGNGIGGVIGFFRVYTHQCYVKLYYVELDDNTIVYESEGDTGLNEREADSVSNNSNSYVAVGGILGRIYKPSEDYLGYVYGDNIILHPNNIVGIRAEGSDSDNTDAVKLITADDKLADVELPAVSDRMTMADAAAQLAEDYGYYVGTVIGVNHGSMVYPYMMRIRGSADEDTPPVLNQKNAPTTDVGRIPGMESETYRNRSHIIYGTRNSAAEDGKANVEFMDGAVEEAFAEYTGSETLQEICQVYRLVPELTAQNVGTSGDGTTEEITKAVSEIWSESYSLTKEVSGTEQKLPILVCRPGVVSLDQQIKLFSDIMTDVAGVSAAKVGILSVSQKQVAWDLTSDTKTKTTPTEEEAHISVTRDTSNEYFFEYNGTEHFDSYDEENNVLNYTELTFTYAWDNSCHVRRFVLPVFVEEPLILDVQAKMLAGRVSSVAAMADGVSDTATIANDSDYTLLLDFSYGNARASYDRTMEKQIYLTNEQGIKQFETGTRLLLIDVANGNKPYYYTVTDSSPEKIPLSSFTDTGAAAGTAGTTAYTEQKISRTLNSDGTTYDGHDVYILQVLPGVKGENAIYDIHAGFSEVDDTNKSTYSMEGTTEAVITVDAIPGLQFQLLEVGASGNLVEPQQGTLVSGELTEGGVLTIDMEYCVKMDPEYRSKTNPMDSANNDKYLDLACYLTDANGKRIALPDGTNIQYTDADGNVVTKALTDYASVYYYKDMEETEYQIRGENGNVTDTVQNALQIKILLPEDISGLTEDTYTVHIDLLRTDDPAYPAGYEDALDTYEYTIGAEVIPKLGFAVTIDEEDWDKLGVNTWCYEEEFPLVKDGETQIHEIPFKVQVDFRNILKSLSGEELLADWAEKDYYITYRIFGKMTDGSYPDVVFEDEISPETIRVAAKEDASEDASAGDSYVTGSDGSLLMKYQFTEDEIQANEDTLLQKGTPIEREGKVILNMDQLKGIRSKADLEKYLTNYKMEAVLQITDRDVAPSEIQPDDVSDFFVFTVTRLKTDIE